MNTGFQWMCGNDKTLVCKRHINNGAYGEVYEALLYLLKKKLILVLDGAHSWHFQQSTRG